MKNKSIKKVNRSKQTSGAKSILYGLILGGGKSRRMQQDKSVLNYHGKPQTVYCYELLKSYCQNVFLSNREDQSTLNGHEGLPQIHDDKKYHDIGPLGGILSAMERYPDVCWLVLACDLPYVNASTIKNLIEKRNPKKPATAYASSFDGLPEPLCAIYETGIYKKMLSFLKKGINCPRKILINSDIELITPNDKMALNNINDPVEFKEALQHLHTLSPNKASRNKRIQVQYYALLRESRGTSQEIISTSAATAGALYEELKVKHGFQLPIALVRVAINNEFRPWETPLKPGDQVVLIPPVAGG